MDFSYFFFFNQDCPQVSVHMFMDPSKVMTPGRKSSPYPALQLRRELGLKPACGPFAVVPLDEHLVGKRRAVPQLLQVMELSWTENKDSEAAHVLIVPGQIRPPVELIKLLFTPVCANRS